MSTAKTLVMVKNTFIEVESDCGPPGIQGNTERRPRTESADAVLQYPCANAFTNVIPETIYEHLSESERREYPEGSDITAGNIDIRGDDSGDSDGVTQAAASTPRNDTTGSVIKQIEGIKRTEQMNKSRTEETTPRENARRHDGRDGRAEAWNDKANVLSSNSDDSDVNGKTTVMLRNIPNKYTQKMILDVINDKFRGLYDFFYLPIDFRNRCNVGYAFINYLHTSYAQSFKKEYQGHKLTAFKSHKVCEVSWGRVQGLKANIEHYRNSAVMSVNIPQYKPLLFRNGMGVPFPDSDRPLPSVKLRPLRGGGRDSGLSSGENGPHRLGSRGSTNRQPTNAPKP